MEKEIDVPPFFLCPISLEIMKDPVTISTGITYDRDSIEKWLFLEKNTACPVTKQALISYDVTPNHTLRRMIQSWCTLNASHGIERIPTPKAPVTKLQVEKLIKEAKSQRQKIKVGIEKLRSIASENETNKRCLEEAGVVEFLAWIINNFLLEDNSKKEDGLDSVTEEALSLLYNLEVSQSGLKSLLENKNGIDIISSLTKIMQRGSYESRVFAVLLTKSLLEVAEQTQLIISNLNPELLVELVRVLDDHMGKASRAALKTLILVCPHAKNRQKAVQAGAVPVLIELLLDQDSSGRRMIEMEMMVLDILCQCAEGRAAFLGHSTGMAVVSKKILRVSRTASERAVNILLSVGKFCGTAGLVQEMVQLGVAAKLCFVLQADCGRKTKDKVRELLKLHARAWGNSPCIPLHFLASSYGA